MKDITFVDLEVTLNTCRVVDTELSDPTEL